MLLARVDRFSVESSFSLGFGSVFDRNVMFACVLQRFIAKMCFSLKFKAFLLELGFGPAHNKGLLANVAVPARGSGWCETALRSPW